MKPLRKNLSTIAMSLLMLIILGGCSSVTLIQSEPSKAKVYLDGMKMGTTPYSMRDSKIAGTCTYVRLEKEGYEPFHVDICRDEEAAIGPIIGGFFFIIPFLWCMKYYPVHNYELSPLAPVQVNPPQIDPVPQAPAEEKVYQATPPTKTKADRLRELKYLRDEGLITEEEYTKEKQKVLDER